LVVGPKLSRVNVAEAKKSLSKLLGRVAYGKERITIVKHGRPMACLVPVSSRNSAALADVKVRLDDNHPFFKNIDEIVAERHKRRPRRPPRLAG
jgi:prevent-host-death family protein